MAYWLRVLTAFRGLESLDSIGSQHLHGCPQMPIIPAEENLMPFSDICRHMVHTVLIQAQIETDTIKSKSFKN